MEIFEDIQKDVEFFFDDLNWTYIIIYAFILFGIKYKEEFLWYNRLFDKHETLKSFKVWAAGLIVMIIFCIFTSIEVGLTSPYVSQMLRSWIVVIVFNSITTKKLKSLDVDK